MSVVRWQITGKVVAGTQALSRLPDSSHVGFTGGGSITSTWIARWKVRVRVDTPSAGSPAASGSSARRGAGAGR